MFCGILSIAMLKYFCVLVTSHVLTDDNISAICCQRLQGKKCWTDQLVTSLPGLWVPAMLSMGCSIKGLGENWYKPVYS